jgi:hypothetical protein
MRNTSLMRMHLGIAVCYLCVFRFIDYAVGAASTSSWAGVWILGVIAAVPIGLHLCAARGVRKGAAWGKIPPDSLKRCPAMGCR